jgi:hypothetical protein
MKKRYEKPMAKAEDSAINGAQAYSVAAAPAAAVAVKPVVTAGAILAAAVVTTWC